MKNVITKNTFPDLPDNYRWDFHPYTDIHDELNLQKRFMFWWETVRSETVYITGDDARAIAQEMYNKEFGVHTRNPFYGTSR